jgi:hypothetical protein
MVTVEILSPFAHEAGIRAYATMDEAVAETARIVHFEPHQADVFRTRGFASNTLATAMVLGDRVTVSKVYTAETHDILALLDAVAAE